MKGNRRFLVILLMIFLLLAAALALQENSSRNVQPTPQSTPQLRRIFPDLAVLDIIALRVQDRITGETFTIARDIDGTWLAQSVDQETTQPLEENAGTNLVRSFVLLGHVQTIELTEERALAEFGFRSDAQMYITAITADNIQHAVAVGDPLQTGPYYYVIIDDRPEIYVVDRAAIDYLAAVLDTPPLATQ